MLRRASGVQPPSHRRRGATAVLVQHKLQWHRHDRRGSAVVPSLIAIAPQKTVKTEDLRGGTAETLNIIKTSTVSLWLGQSAVGSPWHRTRTALAPSSPPCLHSSTAVQSRKSRLATLRRSRGGSAEVKCLTGRGKTMKNYWRCH